MFIFFDMTHFRGYFLVWVFLRIEAKKNCFWDFLTCKDQIAWNKKGGTYNDNCNMHSWHIEKPCCYSSDHRNKNCMWKAFERLVGWSIGNIYEVSAMNTRRNYNFDMAMEQWKGTSKVLRWALFYETESETWSGLGQLGSLEFRNFLYL